MFSELSHNYGNQVHVVDNLFLTTLLARLCSPQVVQPEFHDLITTLYQSLLTQVIHQEFESSLQNIPTRMTSIHPEKLLSGKFVNMQQKCVVVDIARAGIVPSLTCYQALHRILPPHHIRQDHIVASRLTESNSAAVFGTLIESAKIGGDIADRFVLIPDPMAATGHTISATIHHYKKNISGQPKKWIALHMIATPEYLKHMSQQFPELTIYTLRVDRGMSPEFILQTPLGKHWDSEKGLNEKDYIVPGGGGFGELMNNSFV